MLGIVGPNSAPTIGDATDSHIPAGSLVTVTIGRNVRAGYSELAQLGHLSGAQVPMLVNHWDTFVGDVRRLLSHQDIIAAQVFGPFYGVGEWEGISEQSATLTALTTRPYDVARLDAELAVLADVYDQDAIAWSFGAAQLALRPVAAPVSADA